MRQRARGGIETSESPERGSGMGGWVGAGSLWSGLSGSASGSQGGARMEAAGGEELRLKLGRPGEAWSVGEGCWWDRGLPRGMALSRVMGCRGQA